MVFGSKHIGYQISNATIARNIFLRNGARQTSVDHGEIVFLERNSSGIIEDNLFFAVDPAVESVFYEPITRAATGFVRRNNTIYGQKQVDEMIAPTPGVGGIVYDPDGAAATITLIDGRGIVDGGRGAIRRRPDTRQSQ